MAERPKFIDQLRLKWDENKAVCVGIDVDPEMLPTHLQDDRPWIDRDQDNSKAMFNFATILADRTQDVVAAYKLNGAFFEGNEETLRRIVGYIHTFYPNIPVIGDMKRADIGNTNRFYAASAFDRFGFDAMTLNGQYFGSDTFSPFEAYPDRGLFVMAKTSNPGSSEIQDMRIDVMASYYDGLLTPGEHRELLERGMAGLRVSEMVAFMAPRRWNKSGNLGLVVAATHPEAFARMRALAGDLPFLVPGIGAQGGNLETAIRCAPDSKGQGIIISSSREIIYASSGRDFAEAARAKTLALHNQIISLRKN